MGVCSGMLKPSESNEFGRGSEFSTHGSLLDNKLLTMLIY
jgi:hypothetical protein